MEEETLILDTDKAQMERMTDHKNISENVQVMFSGNCARLKGQARPSPGEEGKRREKKN
jgi:hypothetical protein